MVYAQDIDHSHDKWLAVILDNVETSAKSQTNILPAVSNRIQRSYINWIIRVCKRLWEACGLVHLTDSLLGNSSLSDIKYDLNWIEQHSLKEIRQNSLCNYEFDSALSPWQTQTDRMGF